MQYSKATNRGIKKGTNLKLISGDSYKNFPLLPRIGYFYESHLDTIYRGTQIALDSYPRAFAVRVDLRFPYGYDPYGTGVANRFIESIQSQIDASMKRRNSPHSCKVRFIRVLEQGGRNLGWHYHVVLFFNAHAYRSIGKLDNINADNLANRIRKAWSRALHISESEGFHLVHFPANGSYLLEQNSASFNPTLSDFMKRLSYFAKQRTKVHGEHRRVIERSRR